MYFTIIGGQAYPLQLFPGMEVSSSFQDGVVAHYWPSLPEILLGLSGVSIAMLLTGIALKLLPFLPRPPKPDHRSYFHDAAPLIPSRASSRSLGRGKTLSRSLTIEEAQEAMAMILAERAAGAAWRIPHAASDEGGEPRGDRRLRSAARAAMSLPSPLPKVDLDWSSYAGKRRQLPWYILRRSCSPGMAPRFSCTAQMATRGPHLHPRGSRSACVFLSPGASRKRPPISPGAI